MSFVSGESIKKIRSILLVSQRELIEQLPKRISRVTLNKLEGSLYLNSSAEYNIRTAFIKILKIYIDDKYSIFDKQELKILSKFLVENKPLENSIRKAVNLSELVRIELSSNRSENNNTEIETLKHKKVDYSEHEDKKSRKKNESRLSSFETFESFTITKPDSKNRHFQCPWCEVMLQNVDINKNEVALCGHCKQRVMLLDQVLFKVIY